VKDTAQVPEAEQGDLPSHVVPAELVELHQLNELAGLTDAERADLEELARVEG
jgi:hypothetical protein